MMVRFPMRRVGMLALTAAFAAALGACKVGPDYQRPTVETPAEFKEALASGQWKTADPNDRTDRGRWWTAYQDPLLDDLQKRVDAANQDIVTAEAQFRQARALAQGARAGLMPMVVAGANATRLRRSPNAYNNPSRNGDPVTDLSLGLDVAWELDIWGRVRRTVESRQASAQAFAAELDNLRLSLHAELAVDYFLLRSLDAERDLLERTIVAYRKALELTRNRFEGGVASQGDVSQAETQLNVTLAQMQDLGVQRAQFEHAIAVLIGEPPAKFALAPVPFDAALPETPIVVPSALLERRPDVAAAERQVAAANAQIGVAKAAYYPTLVLGASTGVQGTEISNWLELPSRFWSLGPAAAMTLFDGGRRKALNDQAQAAYDGTVSSYRQTVLSAFADVEDNLAALRVLAEEAQHQDRAIESSRRSLRHTTLRYEGGASNYLDVAITQAITLGIERNAIDIARRRKVASVRLIKAMGGDWKTANLPSDKDVMARGTAPTR